MHRIHKRLCLAAVLGLALIAFMALGGIGPHDSKRASAGVTTTVAIGDFWFCDSSYQGGIFCETAIAAGDTVTWSYTGIAAHTTTECGTPCTYATLTGGPNLWDSGYIYDGGTYSRQFDSPGTFSYSCRVHPLAMGGRIIVLAPTLTPSPTPEPTPTPSPTPEPTPTASPTPSSTAEPTPTPSPSAEATPGPSPSPTPAETASPSPSPSPAPTPRSPTPSPTPGPLPTATTVATAPGDVDCNGKVDAVDALKILRHEADLPVSQAPGCKSIGTTIAAGLNEAAARVAGDVDCDGDVDLTDATEVLRHVAVLAVNLPPGCPAIGETVGG